MKNFTVSETFHDKSMTKEMTNSFKNTVETETTEGTGENSEHFSEVRSEEKERYASKEEETIKTTDTSQQTLGNENEQTLILMDSNTSTIEQITTSVDDNTTRDTGPWNPVHSAIFTDTEAPQSISSSALKIFRSIDDTSSLSLLERKEKYIERLRLQKNLDQYFDERFLTKTKYKNLKDTRNYLHPVKSIKDKKRFLKLINLQETVDLYNKELTKDTECPSCFNDCKQEYQDDVVRKRTAKIQKRNFFISLPRGATKNKPKWTIPTYKEEIKYSHKEDIFIMNPYVSQEEQYLNAWEDKSKRDNKRQGRPRTARGTRKKMGRPVVAAGKKRKSTVEKKKKSDLPPGKGRKTKTTTIQIIAPRIGEHASPVKENTKIENRSPVIETILPMEENTKVEENVSPLEEHNLPQTNDTPYIDELPQNEEISPIEDTPYIEPNFEHSTSYINSSLGGIAVLPPSKPVSLYYALRNPAAKGTSSIPYKIKEKAEEEIEKPQNTKKKFPVFITKDAQSSETITEEKCEQSTPVNSTKPEIFYNIREVEQIATRTPQEEIIHTEMDIEEQEKHTQTVESTAETTPEQNTSANSSQIYRPKNEELSNNSPPKAPVNFVSASDDKNTESESSKRPLFECFKYL